MPQKRDGETTSLLGRVLRGASGYPRQAIGAVLAWLMKLLASMCRRFSAFVKSVGRLTIGVVRETLPIIFCWNIERKALRATRLSESELKLTDEERKYLNVENDELKESHEIELKRRAAIQQRVQGNAATIAVVTGLFGVVLALLKEEVVSGNDAQLLVWVVRLLFTCVVASLIMSGVSAIRAVGISKVSDNWLETRHEKFGFERKRPELAKKAKLIRMIRLNQQYNLNIMNYAHASHRSMRNALIGMGLVLVIILWTAGRS